MPAGEIHEPRQRREVTVGGEHSFGDDQAAPTGGLAEAPLEVVELPVPVGEGIRPGQPAAVHDARVTELVVEHHLSLARQCGHEPQPGEVPRPEQQAALGAVEVGEPLLEAAVHGHRAGAEPRCPGAGPPAHGRLGGGLPDPRVVGQAEVVARAEQQHRSPVEQDVRTLRPGHEAHGAVEASSAKLIEALLDVGDHGRNAREALGRVGCRTREQTRRCRRASVLLRSYTLPMAKVMVSISDDLLEALDAEAARRRTTRSADRRVKTFPTSWIASAVVTMVSRSIAARASAPSGSRSTGRNHLSATLASTTHPVRAAAGDVTRRAAARRERAQRRRVDRASYG